MDYFLNTKNILVFENVMYNGTIIYRCKNKNDFTKMMLWVIDCMPNKPDIRVYGTDKTNEIYDFHYKMYLMMDKLCDKNNFWNNFLYHTLHKIKIIKKIY
jgi:hypothetical protein